MNAKRSISMILSQQHPVAKRQFQVWRYRRKDECKLSDSIDVYVPDVLETRSHRRLDKGHCVLKFPLEGQYEFFKRGMMTTISTSIRRIPNLNSRATSLSATDPGIVEAKLHLPSNIVPSIIFYQHIHLRASLSSRDPSAKAIRTAHQAAEQLRIL